MRDARITNPYLSCQGRSPLRPAIYPPLFLAVGDDLSLRNNLKGINHGKRWIYL